MLDFEKTYVRGEPGLFNKVMCKWFILADEGIQKFSCQLLERFLWMIMDYIKMTH